MGFFPAFAAVFVVWRRKRKACAECWDDAVVKNAVKSHRRLAKKQLAQNRKDGTVKERNVNCVKKNVSFSHRDIESIWKTVVICQKTGKYNSFFYG